MQCPKCGKEDVKKNGIVAGKQRFKCRECGYSFTVDQRGKPNELKRLAVHMYLEGLSLRSIAKALKVSNVAVLKWFKEAGINRQVLSEPQDSVETTTIKLHEMWHFISKNDTRSKSGWLLIELPRTSWGLKQVVTITKQKSK